MPNFLQNKTPLDSFNWTVLKSVPVLTQFLAEYYIMALFAC